MMNRMLSDVAVPPRPVARLEPVVGAARYANLLTAAAAFRTVIAGRTIWNVNSTAAGGGVAEMLQCLVGYVNDLDIPIRWTVVGDERVFPWYRLNTFLYSRLPLPRGGPSRARS